MFLLKKFPKKIVILGAGFIACEFSCIFNKLGVEVIHIVRGQRLLKNFDNEIVRELQNDMISSGIDLRFGRNIRQIRKSSNSIYVDLDDNVSIESDIILFAIGRIPYLNKLDLSKAKIELLKGKIIVNNKNETNISHIYAIGDVTDNLNLTPVAIDEGRAFADRKYGGKFRIVNYELVPKAVFSQPEIASIGLTEEEALKLYGEKHLKIFRSKFRPMSRALPKQGSKCLLKLICEIPSHKVLGCHMTGDHAAEIIQMASIAIGMGATKYDFDNTMALHPTIAEEFVTMV